MDYAEDEPQPTPQDGHVMIRAQLFDCGTKFVYDSRVSVPGMDFGYYRELDFEHDWPGERAEEIQRAVVGVDHPITYKPWPRPFPGYLWIDWVPNYYGVPGGPQVDLLHKDYYTGDYSPVPIQKAQIYDEQNVKANLETKYARTSDLLTQEEVREAVEDPISEPWLRLPLRNEIEQPQLGNRVVMMQDGHEGQGFAVKTNYGDCFQIVDMSHPEWYKFIDQNGETMERDKGRELCLLRKGGNYNLYLAPAKWRMVCNVIGHYWYISYTESYGVPLGFTKAFYTRPAVYTQRHNVIKTKHEDVVNWLGTDYSYDIGVEDGFKRSRGSLNLAFQIIDAQWWTLSEAFIFLFNDPVLMALWGHPPDPGDIVLGVGRVDEYGQEEQITWVVQEEDISSKYPRYVIGLFIVPWTVTT